MQQLGPYILEEELGRGGMGVVWRARDSALDRTVAVKVLLRALASPSDLERFRREALAQARLRHPSIACLLSCGSTTTGQPYLVLDHVEGKSLAATLRSSGPLPERDAARLVATLARALDYAHARGVLHRDLKASNVLLEAATGEPVVIDFGLASLTGAERLTQTGQMLGTPGCMAPEQAMGELSRIGPRTDVYGLGVVLHEALTGRAPFEGAEFLRLLGDVVDVPVPPLSRLRPGLDPRLEAIALRCLEKDPDRRWPTALALAQALEGLAEERRPPAGSRRALGAALAVGAALGASWGGLLALSLAGATREAPPPSRADPAALTSDDLARSARRLVVEAGRVGRDDLRAALGLLDRAVALSPSVEALSSRSVVATRLGEEAASRRDLLALAGGGPDALALAARGLALAGDEAALEVSERAVAATGARDARALAARAFARALRGERTAAEADADAALALEPGEPLALLARGLSGDAREPELLERAQAGFEARGDAPGVAAAHAARARALLRGGPTAPSPAHVRALAELDQALALAPALRRALHLRGLVTLARSVDGRLDRDGLVRAAADAERLCALTDHEASAAELLAYTRLCLALDLERGLDLQEASRALAALTRGLDRDPRSASLLAARAELKGTIGDPVGAEADARAVLAREPPPDPEDRATALLARLRWRRGEATEGLALVTRLVDRPGSRAPYSLAERSMIQSHLRRPGPARADAEKALALAPTLSRGHLALSRALVASGAAADLPRALAEAEETARTSPGLALAHGDVAALRCKLGLIDVPEALRQTARAGALEPWAAEYAVNEAMLMESTGALREAEAALDRAVALDPGSCLARFQRARRRLTADPRAALTDLLRVTERQPWSAEAWLLQASARASLGDPVGAVEDVTRGLEHEEGLRPGDVQAACALRASLLCDLEDGARALPDAERAVQLAPASGEAWRIRGRARALLGQLPAALEDLDGALARSPATPRWRLERAELLVRLGDPASRERARAELEELGPSLPPDGPLARRARALLERLR